MPRGGTVIIGVAEPDFAVHGVDDPGAIESALADQARTLVEPAPFIETQTLYVEGRAVVLGHVEGVLPHQRPALYRGRPYLRMADGDYVMSANDLRMVEVDKLHAREAIAYDSAPVPGSHLEVCDASVLKEAVAELRSATPRLRGASDAELLELFRVVDSQGQLSVAGLYALGRFPQGFFPDLHISAAVQYPAGKKDRVPGIWRNSMALCRIWWMEPWRGCTGISTLTWSTAQMATCARFQNYRWKLFVKSLLMPWSTATLARKA